MKVIKEKKKLIVLVAVIVLAILICVGVAVNATGSSGGIAKSVTFSEDMDGAYVYFRAVDAAGNKGEWSEPERLFIDTANPVVTAKNDRVEIKEKDENDLSTYFNIDENGYAGIVDVTYIDKSNGDVEVKNTSELAVGEHVIEATVEKANGVKATASVIIVVAVLGYTLTFIANGSTYSTITEAKTVEFPEQNPTLANKMFTGWYYDEAATQEATVGDSITANTTLYAGWRSYVLNPNKGETQIIIYWTGQSYIESKNGAFQEKDFDTIYVYEGSTEISYIEVDEETTSADYYSMGYESGNTDFGGELLPTKTYDYEDSDMFQLFYTEGAVLKLNANEFSDFMTTSRVISGLVGVKIHFADGSVEKDVIDFLLFDRCHCLVEGTQITLADRTTKSIEDITYENDLLVWDFDNARFATVKPLWIMKAQRTSQYYLVKFDNGSELKLAIQHRIFNKEKGSFEYPIIDEETPEITTFTSDGTESKVVSIDIIKEKVNYYNIITDYHINLFANGILTSCRLNNIYPIKDMKFQKDNRELATKEEYSNIPEEYFKGLRIAEQPKEINRGNAVKHTSDLEGYVQRLVRDAKSRDSEM